MAINRYHLGCPVWKHQNWVGNFFTKKAKPADFLKQYSSVFNAVEGNSTFYGFPSISTIERWANETPDDFRFSFKIPSTVTHDRKLRETREEIDRFFELMSHIENKLGPFMIQLPAQFAPDELKHLEQFLKEVPPSYHYAVEVRHPEFFGHGKAEAYLNRLLKSFHVDRINFDTRRLHAVKSDDPEFKKIQQRKPELPVRFDTTGSRPVVRYVGSNDVQGNVPYLKEWAIIVAEWIKEGRHPYVYIHAPDEFYAPAIARRFHSMLSKLANLNPMPQWPVDREGPDRKQLDLF